MVPALPWLALPGLAGGIDRDGSRADELLAAGFGSVEFGTVTAAGAVALARTLARRPVAARGSAVGVGLGLPPEIPATAVAGEWLAGLAAMEAVADYASCNLSARANQRFLEPRHGAVIAEAFRAVAAGAAALPLAVKLPLGEAGPLPAAALAAVAAGFAQVTAVLPEGAGRWQRLAALVAAVAGRAAVVAVGGIRSAADVAAARRAGAAGVQVHRLFQEAGAACLARLCPSAEDGEIDQGLVE